MNTPISTPRPCIRPGSSALAEQITALRIASDLVDRRRVSAETAALGLPTNYLVLACKVGKVARFERSGAPEAATTARRLRNLGWAVVCLRPGSWA